MSALLKKLNHKNTQPIVLLNLPAELLFLNEEFNTVSTVSSILTQKVHFLLAFCTMQEEVNTLATQCLPLTEGDATIWFAYPKTASKRYTCNFNRDTGWDIMGKYGFEPVRQVAISEDWSALRFRKVEYIKVMTRSFAMTDEGKAKSLKK